MTAKSPTVLPVPDLRIMRLPEVIQRCGYKRAQIYNMISRGEFPRQIPIGPRAVGWNSQEIDEWVAQRLHQFED